LEAFFLGLFFFFFLGTTEHLSKSLSVIDSVTDGDLREGVLSLKEMGSSSLLSSVAMTGLESSLGGLLEPIVAFVGGLLVRIVASMGGLLVAAANSGLLV